MKLPILFLAAGFLAAAGSLHFDVTDARGKKASGVVIEASDPDADGWRQLSIAQSKKPMVIIWPYDGRVKAPGGPGDVPVIVVSEGAEVSSTKAIAALWAGELLGVKHEVMAAGIGPISGDPFEGGVALLYTHKSAEAMEPLGRAMRERERRLTRVPSEIYAAAMLYGKACFEAGKFDDAAVAFRKALEQRPSDEAAHKVRGEALIKAGKPDAAAN